MKGTPGEHARYLKKTDPSFPIPRFNHVGTIIAPGNQSYLTLANETPAEKEIRLREFAKTHTMIKWDGNDWPWDCSDEDFEVIERDI